MLRRYFYKKRIARLIEQKACEVRIAEGIFNFIPSKYYSQALYVAKKQLETLKKLRDEK